MKTAVIRGNEWVIDLITDIRKVIGEEISRRNGILNLLPCWVARKYLLPGKRLKLDLRDMYIRGAEKGAICERWLSSTGMADNGELTVENEGLSEVSIGEDKQRLLFRDVIAHAGDLVIGEEDMKRFGGLLSFAKLYDFQTPIGHHVHLMEKDCAWLGVTPKPEAYYFPKQLNTIDYNAAYTFFGVIQGTTKEDIKRCLINWAKYGDNGILEYSQAYKLRVGTGWDVPAGILHAPGSLVTYEPQRVSDTSLFWQSMIRDTYTDKDLAIRFIPPDKREDYDYIVDVLDWEANMDPNFKLNHYHEPLPANTDIEADGYEEKWIVYGSTEFSGKELRVLPGRSAVIRDSAAYGLLMMEGFGSINGNPIETPAMISYGKQTADEMYVVKDAACKGVLVENHSKTNDLIMLKHFGPGNPDAVQFIKI